MVAWTPPASLCKRIESAVNHLVMTLMPLSMPVEARCPMNCGINSWEEATSTFDGGGFSSPTVRETSITKIHFRTTILTTTASLPQADNVFCHSARSLTNRDFSFFSLRASRLVERTTTKRQVPPAKSAKRLLVQYWAADFLGEKAPCSIHGLS